MGVLRYESDFIGAFPCTLLRGRIAGSPQQFELVVSTKKMRQDSDRNSE
jgi:hypothetical protein